MDITSYLIGKKSGGGSTPTLQEKEVTIIENGTTNVTADAGYDGLGTVGVTTNVQPDLETKSVTITENTTTTITPTTGKDGMSSVSVTTNVSGGGDYDMQVKLDTTSQTWGTPVYTRITEISFPVTTTFLAVDSLFGNFSRLTTVSLFDTSNNTSFYYMFSGCTNITNIPAYNTSKVTNFQNMFNNIGNKLTDTSLDNVLQMCIGATSYTGTKTLAQLGLNNYRAPVSRVEALPHYQDFLNAGWTIGYEA